MARIGFQFTHLVELYRAGVKRFMRVSSLGLRLTLWTIVLGRAQPLVSDDERAILRLPPLQYCQQRTQTSGEHECDVRLD